jgi:three-Cys-motif partner protein
VWTEQKAKLIARYLQLFTFVTKHGTYIDGFAGPQQADVEGTWAAKLVLANEPRRMLHFYLCDNDNAQIEALNALKGQQPAPAKGESKREIEVIPGDFNDLVGHVLASKHLDPATFCLLDQRTFECKWSTVEALARHRTTGYKIEIFYFLPIWWLTRAFIATTKNPHEIDAWWGATDWERLIDMKHHEKALAFKQRFEQLGYSFVWPFPIMDRENGNRVMFYMILASDHPEAPKLMWRAYNKGVFDDQGWDQLTMPL